MLPAERLRGGSGTLSSTRTPCQPDSMSENKENVASIQLLRGFAALFVVIMHEQYFFALYAPQVGDPLPAMSSWHHFKTAGGMGVPLFFVISGFIMV